MMKKILLVILFNVNFILPKWCNFYQSEGNDAELIWHYHGSREVENCTECMKFLKENEEYYEVPLIRYTCTDHQNANIQNVQLSHAAPDTPPQQTTSTSAPNTVQQST